jgi:penicillin-binding protein 2
LSQRSRLNLIIIEVLIASLIIALFGRLFYLQIAAGFKYRNAALSVQSRDVITPGVRGAITDSSGVPMAMDLPGLVITIDRSVIDKLPDKGESVITRVAHLIGKSRDDVWIGTRLCGELPIGERAGCWKGTKFQPIPVTSTATQAQALKVLENADSYTGVDAQQTPVRSYPALGGETGAHVLGYVGSVTESDLANPDLKLYQDEIIGKTGLEYQYDSYLRGKPGIRTVIVDRKESVTEQTQNSNPIPGDNLVTNLNAKLQGVTEKALESSVRRAKSLGYRADGGAAIVMDVKTGKVLALASYPTYDLSIFQKGLTRSEAKALFSDATGVPALDRPLQGMYAPASTFKSISIVAAKMAGYDLNARYDCPASVQVGDREFKNFESSPLGRINMQTAIAISCDTVWYKIAYDEWVRDGGLRPKSNLNDYFFNAARSFDLGKKTGIDLPEESSGRLPDRQWKNDFYKQNKDFYCNFQSRAKKSDLTPYLIAIAKENCTDGYIIRAGDAVNFSIGQGDTLMTPIQMAVAYSAIANGGTLWKPWLARAIINPQGKVLKEFTKEVTGKTEQTPEVTSFLHKALRSVATNGTAAPVFSNFPVQVAGKTGTGQDLGRNKNGSPKDDTSWFASFAPADSPKYAVVMVVSQGGFGASVSAVGVKDIYSALFGVVGGRIDPTKSVFPDGIPNGIPNLDLKNAQVVKK